jgi:dephospho-CoA kinase
MPAIAITGGVATGKSTVSRLLYEKLRPHLAVELFNADFEAKRLTESDSVVQREIRSVFGEGIFDPEGHLRRDKMREWVFNDATAREALEKILHPRIRDAWLGRAQSARDWFLVEIPLLYETQAEYEFKLTIVTACSRASQIDRLVRERNLSESLAGQIIAAQMNLETKMQRADRVLWTECPPEITAQQIDRLVLDVAQIYGGSSN